MWCANCRADVAAEVASNHRDLRCTTCGEALQTAAADDKTRDARRLLERWSHDELLPTSPLAGGPTPVSTSAAATSENESAPPSRARERQEPSKPVFRVDIGHNSAGQRRPATTEPRDTPPREFPAAGESLHAAHKPAAPPPHVEVSEFLQDDDTPQSSNWVAASGQFLAYGGVAVLTVGATLVVWGFFGGPEHYAPTGWLTVTIGQMLLFLGIVTLISGGMEQTTSEVSRRIQILGDHIIRIEQAAQSRSVPPPHAPIDRFASAGQSPTSTSQRDWEGGEGTAVGAR